MKISKAIKNLTRGRKDAGMIPEKEYTATIDLATEALKREKARREGFFTMVGKLLPGETPE